MLSLVRRQRHDSRSHQTEADGREQVESPALFLLRVSSSEFPAVLGLLNLRLHLETDHRG